MENSWFTLSMAERVYNPVELINMAVAFTVIFAGFLALFNVVKWWFQFILSAGDENKVKEAINGIRYAITGLVITFLSFVVITWVGNIFGYNLLEYINISKIIQIVNTITHNASVDL